MLSTHEIGADLTLLNTEYRYPRKNNETGKYDKGSLTLMYKDNMTGEKFTEYVEDPPYDFYFAKDGQYQDYNEFFIEKEKVDKITVPFRDLEKRIAELTDNTQFYYDNIKCGNRYANKQLHTDPRVFNSDLNIEDFYRIKFSTLYGNKIIPINKSYFDIEADTINMKGDFPELGECPINAVTYIDDRTCKVYTLLLRNKDNPLIEEFEKSLGPNLFNELKTFVRDKVGGWKNEVRFGLDKFNYEIIFYDEEIKLIQDLFIIMNTLKPDFILAWNMAFDIPYIQERLKKIGYDPASIMCHPDFKNPASSYYVDTRHENDLAERGDFACISSYSVFLDQMIHFASRRKGQGVFQRYSLDYIGEAVTRVRKLDYSHITTEIAQLPYLDYKTFVFYNIMDTIVQKCIEVKTGDIEYIFSKCIVNNTRYHKGHRQTVYLVNRGTKEMYDDGFIIGNNVNKNNEKPGKFPGALVADPVKLNDYAKIKINGQTINAMDNVDDYDYKSLYPSEMREFNMAPHTQIGMIRIPNQVHNKENRFKSDTYSRGGSFIEDLHSGIYLEFCHRWLHLADYLSLYKDIQEYYTTKAIASQGLRWYTPQGNIIPVQFVDKNMKMKAVSFDSKPSRAVDFYIKPQIANVYDYFHGGGYSGSI